MRIDIITGNSQNYNVSYPSSQDTKPCMAIIIKYSFCTSTVVAVHNIHIMCCKNYLLRIPYSLYNYFHSQFLITKLVRFEALFQHTFFRVVNYGTTRVFVLHAMKTEENYYPAPPPLLSPFWSFWFSRVVLPGAPSTFGSSKRFCFSGFKH